MVALTGFDPALVRRMHGRLDGSLFQQFVATGRVASVYDATATRPDPTPRQLSSEFPDPILGGFQAPVTSAMVAIYTQKLNWHPDFVYRLASDSAFEEWDWGRGLGRPESLTALQAARSVDPHLRVLIAHGLFDLRTPYFASARLLDMLPDVDGAAPVALRVYSGRSHVLFRRRIARRVAQRCRGDASAP